MTEPMTPAERRRALIDAIKARHYECFIEDHEPLPWSPGRCADYAGRSLHLMRCKRAWGYGLGGLFCRQHAKADALERLGE